MMDASLDGLSARGRRLPSIFDGIPTGTPLALENIEALIQTDTQRRILVVLDRVFGVQSELQSPETAEPT